MNVDVPDELIDVLKFCTGSSASVIDEKRRDFLHSLKMLQLEVEEERVRWLAEEVATPHKRLLSGINAPLGREAAVNLQHP